MKADEKLHTLYWVYPLLGFPSIYSNFFMFAEFAQGHH